MKIIASYFVIQIFHLCDIFRIFEMIKYTFNVRQDEQLLRTIFYSFDDWANSLQTAYLSSGFEIRMVIT